MGGGTVSTLDWFDLDLITPTSKNCELFTGGLEMTFSSEGGGYSEINSTPSRLTSGAIGSSMSLLVITGGTSTGTDGITDGISTDSLERCGRKLGYSF